MSARQLHFAYGSNLNDADRRRWCREEGVPDFFGPPVRVAWLPDHEAVFHYYSSSRQGGALDVTPRAGQLVAGALYEMGAEEARILARKEGAPHRYERCDVHVLGPDLEVVPAFTFRVSEAHRRPTLIEPTAEYLRVVCEGLRSLGLDDAGVRHAARGEPAPWLIDGLFMYGTLMRGECRHACLQSAWGIDGPHPATARGALVDLGEYPGLVAGTRVVPGEYVRFREPGMALAALDQVEGFVGHGRAAGSLFERVLIDATVGAGPPRRAWTYRWGGRTAGAPIVDGGWRDVR